MMQATAQSWVLTGAVRLYEKLGFRHVGDYREQGLLDAKWTDTRIMELIL